MCMKILESGYIAIFLNPMSPEPTIFVQFFEWNINMADRTIETDAKQKWHKTPSTQMSPDSCP